MLNRGYSSIYTNSNIFYLDGLKWKKYYFYKNNNLCSFYSKNKLKKNN
jgi:hypothetical protein